MHLLLVRLQYDCVVVVSPDRLIAVSHRPHGQPRDVALRIGHRERARVRRAIVRAVDVVLDEDYRPERHHIDQRVGHTARSPADQRRVVVVVRP